MKFQVLWKDSKKFKHSIIALGVVLILILSYCLSVFHVFAVTDPQYIPFHFYARFQPIYGGTIYPYNISDGLELDSGVFYRMGQAQVQDADGNSVTVVNDYYTFNLDFSSLNLNYEYDLILYGRVGNRVSFDGFLTTNHTFSSSDSVLPDTVRFLTIQSPVFTPISVSVAGSSYNSYNGVYYYSVSLNSVLQSDGSLVISYSSGSQLSIPYFCFLVELTGSRFSQILYNTSNISSHSDYVAIVGDISDSAANGDISVQEAAALIDIASAQDQEIGYNYVVALKTQVDGLFSSYETALAGCDTEAEAKLVAQNYQNSLASSLESVVPTLTSTQDIETVYTIYQVSSEMAEESYALFLVDLFKGENASLDQQIGIVHTSEMEFLDDIDLVSLSALIDLDAWYSEITPEERVNFVNLMNQFFLSSWKWFFIIPMIFGLIAMLLGTSSMRFGRTDD